MKNKHKNLPEDRKNELLSILKLRFEKNMNRHKNLEWSAVEAKLDANPDKLWTLDEMEVTGGEPDVVGYDAEKDEFLFMDCSKESPKERRSICYDPEALEARKMHKPHNSAIQMAEDMGIEILDEEQYKYLQQFGPFDTKTSSWLKTPSDVRKLGGALFGDYRFARVFSYHNGAGSCYGARGLRGLVRVSPTPYFCIAWLFRSSGISSIA